MKPLITLLLFSIAPMATYALPSDAQQPITIKSDTFQYVDTTGIATYQGHVKATQGSRQLTGDKAVILLDKQHQITRLTLYGKPARYQYLPKNNGKWLHAHANIIEYQPKKALLSLKHKAYIEQNGNAFKGPLITYNTKTRTVQTQGAQNGQTTMIIQPYNKLKQHHEK